MDFDQNNIVLRFGALSDIHQNNNPEWPNEKKLYGAFKKLNEISDNKLDLILIGGDLTDYGRPDEIEPFIRAIDQNIKPGLPILFALGNHDINHEPLMDYSFIYGEKNIYFDKLKSRCYSEDLDMERAFCGSRHIQINGYHFFAVHAQHYDFEHLVSSEREDLEWLRENLEKLTREDPDKPIFITTHPVMRNTYADEYTGYANFWASEDIDEVIKDFPQVVMFTGHIHELINDERIISQNNYTSISMPSLLYFAVPGFYIENGYNFFSDFREPTQFMYCEVDKNNAIRIQRFDLQLDEKLPRDWIIMPRGDKNFLKQYDKSRIDKIKPPYFENNNSFGAERFDDKTIIKFMSANDEYGVQHYEITVKNITKDQQIYSFNSIASYYRKNALTYMSEQHSVEIKALEKECKYEITVYAVNYFGKKSEAAVFVI